MLSFWLGLPGAHTNYNSNIPHINIPYHSTTFKTLTRYPPSPHTSRLVCKTACECVRQHFTVLSRIWVSPHLILSNQVKSYKTSTSHNTDITPTGWCIKWTSHCSAAALLLNPRPSNGLNIEPLISQNPDSPQHDSLAVPHGAVAAVRSRYR